MGLFFKFGNLSSDFLENNCHIAKNPSIATMLLKIKVLGKSAGYIHGEKVKIGKLKIINKPILLICICIYGKNNILFDDT